MYFVFLLLYLLCALTCTAVTIAGLWTSFSKAGRPGWAAIVPVYNGIVFLDVAGKPWWWILIFLVPLVIMLLGFLLGIILGSFTVILIFYALGGLASLGSLAFAIIATLSFAKNFGKGGGYACGLIFLPFVFYPLLGFGDAEYSGQVRWA